MKSAALHAGILIAGIAAPFAFPAHTTQVAILWIFILFALTWDVMGGQMGYNSLGNILFFGLGMYVCAIAQIGMFYDVAEYTAERPALPPDAEFEGGLPAADESDEDEDEDEEPADESDEDAEVAEAQDDSTAEAAGEEASEDADEGEQDDERKA